MKEHPRYKGFYVVSGYDQYALSPTGMLINTKRNKIVSGSTNPAGYHNYRLTDKNGYTFTWGRHRLLCWVFKNPGKDIRNLTVNHINGIKGDDRLDNLEWATYRENQEHAGLLGLTTKCTPVSVRDVKTGRVAKYPSMVVCARRFGVSCDFINYRVKAGESRIFPEGKQYRGSHSDDPWPDGSKYFYADKSRIKTPILLKDLMTGEIKEFKSMKLLSRFLKVSPSTITVWMHSPDQPVLPGKIQLKSLYDPAAWRTVLDPIIEMAKFSSTRPVMVIDDTTKEAAIFDSSVECCRAMSLNPTALHYRLQSNGSRVFSDNCRYGYYEGKLFFKEQGLTSQ